MQPATLENSLVSTSSIQQALVFGRNKPRNVALIVVDAAAVCAQLKITPPLALHDLLAQHRQEVEALALDAVRKANDLPSVRHYEAISAFHLLETPFSLENGMLTNKLSVKRAAVEKHYADVLDALYAE